MKKPDNQQLRWELTRERFRIEASFPPPEKRTEKRIGDILSGILKKEASGETILPKALIDRWPLLVGEQLAKHVQPSHITNDILYLHADHPGWLAELRRWPKTHLLKKIASIPDLPQIKEIRFHLDPAIRPVRK